MCWIHFCLKINAGPECGVDRAKLLCVIGDDRRLFEPATDLFCFFLRLPFDRSQRQKQQQPNNIKKYKKPRNQWSPTEKVGVCCCSLEYYVCNLLAHFPRQIDDAEIEKTKQNKQIEYTEPGSNPCAVQFSLARCCRP